MYCYPKIQNMLLHIMGDMLWKQISEAVVQAGYFSLLVDESKDASRKEQLAIVLRYVDEKAIIHERFPSLVEATYLTAESGYLSHPHSHRTPTGSCMYRYSRIRWTFCHEWKLLWCAATTESGISMCCVYSLLCTQAEFCSC